MTDELVNVSEPTTAHVTDGRKLRVGYVVTFDPAGPMGLWEKLQDRLALWADSGVVADVAVCVRDTSSLARAEMAGPHKLHPLIASRSFLATRHLGGWAKRVRPDVIYARYALPWPGLRSLARYAPVVLEHHADEAVERRWRPWGVKVVSWLGSSYVLKAASGFVYIDPALSDSQHLSRFPAAKMVLTNGVRIDRSVQFGSVRDRKPGPPRLVMSVGVPERWHGLDKYEALAELCPDLEFHVIGAEGLAASRPNLIYHGRLDVPAHDRLLHQMDIGVGSLGLERIDCEFASPLKVRGYIRAGLPVVLGHTDPDLPASEESVLSLGYGFAVTVDIARRLQDFAARQTGRTCSPALANNVDARTKEDRRLAFLRELAAPPRRPSNPKRQSAPERRPAP
ncbi:hypothetical protein [Actinopolymorpha pittospori]|uniref:Uncharacterized protein n=1 Tax=Actinopolymorpha pittospori TaxID=648752 RepID=A0A927RFJ3_9ACTN|nr:hypothetical protein [Actinopolymorpha pittospori]MBE1603286.1 hypothetical protein [Actinopolymorpha pittospori]